MQKFHPSVTTNNSKNMEKTYTVNKTMGRVVVKLFHSVPGSACTGQKRNTLDTPCFCQTEKHESWRLMFSPPSWEFAKLHVNVSFSPLGSGAGNGSVESVFLCVGSGCGWRASKSKSFRNSLRRSSIIWKQETGWIVCIHRGNYKSPEVRTSVWAVAWTPAVFSNICSLVLLRQTGVYSNLNEVIFRYWQRF